MFDEILGPRPVKKEQPQESEANDKWTSRAMGKIIDTGSNVRSRSAEPSADPSADPTQWNTGWDTGKMPKRPWRA